MKTSFFRSLFEPPILLMASPTYTITDDEDVMKVSNRSWSFGMATVLTFFTDEISKQAGRQQKE